MKFPLGGIVKLLIGYISNIAGTVLPDDLDGRQKVWMQSSVGSAYAFAKNFGQQLVISTENDLDDKVLDELIEVCEMASEKYGIELNPENVTPDLVTMPPPVDDNE